MTHEFDHVRVACASSVIGRITASLARAAASAWRTSATGNLLRSIDTRARGMAAPALLRTMALAVLIAALAQPLLITVMPATVAPAMPRAAYVLVAVFAATIAWQSTAVVSAWPASGLARWIRR